MHRVGQSHVFSRAGTVPHGAFDASLNCCLRCGGRSEQYEDPESEWKGTRGAADDPGVGRFHEMWAGGRAISRDIGVGSGGFTRCDVDARDARRLKPLGAGVRRVQRRCCRGTDGMGSPTHGLCVAGVWGRQGGEGRRGSVWRQQRGGVGVVRGWCTFGQGETLNSGIGMRGWLLSTEAAPRGC